MLCAFRANLVRGQIERSERLRIPTVDQGKTLRDNGGKPDDAEESPRSVARLRHRYYCSRDSNSVVSTFTNSNSGSSRVRQLHLILSQTLRQVLDTLHTHLVFRDSQASQRLCKTRFSQREGDPGK